VRITMSGCLISFIIGWCLQLLWNCTDVYFYGKYCLLIDIYFYHYPP
jgi:hypothetical protein